MSTKMFDVNKELDVIKSRCNPDNLGMILLHNGVVRGTSKSGKAIRGMIVEYDEEKLKALKKRVSEYEFVEAIEIFINRGNLRVGDDIMFVVLAGNDRHRLLPLFESIIEEIKSIVKETEL